MMISKKRAGALASVAVLLVLGALAVPGLPGADGEARAKEKGTWQDLVFLYTTDIKGKIEPCG